MVDIYVKQNAPGTLLLCPEETAFLEQFGNASGVPVTLLN